MEMNALVIIGLVSAGLSLLFTYLPGLSAKWELLASDKKRLYMLGMVVLTAAVVFALDCFAVLDTTLVCETKSALDLLYAVVIGVATNQGTYSLTKRDSSG